MVHTYYCHFTNKKKAALHDFLDNVRFNRFTMTFKTVSGFYALFVGIGIIGSLIAMLLFSTKFPTTQLLVMLVLSLAIYPIAYYSWRERVAEGVHSISVKLLSQPQIKAKPEDSILQHEDLVAIGNAEVAVVLGYLKVLESQAQALAAGKFKDAVHEQEVAGTLGDAFKKMRLELMANLSNLITSAKNTGEAVNEQSQAVLHSSDEISGSVQQMTVATQDLSTGAQKLSEAVEQVRSQIAETSINVKKGSDSIQQLVTDFDAVTNGMSDSSSKVKELNEKSKQIGKIIDVINQISEQTNLLALNAAIEAARAGEAGKGFAVVADEVRKLAEESQRATKQIGQLLGGVQQSVDASVNSIEKNVAIITQSRHSVSGAVESFEKIPESLQTANDRISEASSVAETTAANSEELNASFEEVSASMTGLKQTATGMSGKAQDLKTEISKINIDV